MHTFWTELNCSIYHTRVYKSEVVVQVGTFWYSFPADRAEETKKRIDSLKMVGLNEGNLER